MNSANVYGVGMVIVSNMMADELQGQKHLGALIADEAGVAGADALRVSSATASGASALRVGAMAVASGLVDIVAVVGVEKMRGGVGHGMATPVLAKALDAVDEVPDGATMLSQNAKLMQAYLNQYDVPDGALSHFAVNAHKNGNLNPHALFRNKTVDLETAQQSRIIVPPLNLYDCAPICDGAAAVILAPTQQARLYTETPIEILASAGSTDRFRVDDRMTPLELSAGAQSARLGYEIGGVRPADIDFYEPHDAFSIMTTLLLEASGFAQRGEGWRLAVEGHIGRDGTLPLSTMGGLKARGHPIGATALYQACEIVAQLRGEAGQNQLPDPRTAMMHSIGGAGTTIVAHIFRRNG